MADRRICEAGATWHQLSSAVRSHKFKTLKFKS